MVTLRDSFDNFVEGLSELSEEELESVNFVMDIEFAATGERTNICVVPLKQWADFFGDMMDLSNLGEVDQEAYDEIFTRHEIDINPELLVGTAETED